MFSSTCTRQSHLPLPLPLLLVFEYDFSTKHKHQYALGGYRGDCARA